MKLVTTVQIAAAPEAVWAFISDVQRYSEWVVGTNKVLSTTTAVAEAGTLYREQTQLGPSVSETTWHITVCDAPHVQVHTSSSAMMDALLTMTVVPENGGTRLTHVVEGRLLPRIRPLGWMLERLIQPKVAKDLRRTLQQAKHMVEQEHAHVQRPMLQPV